MCLWSREHIAHVTWPEDSVIASSNVFFKSQVDAGPHPEHISEKKNLQIVGGRQQYTKLTRFTIHLEVISVTAEKEIEVGHELCVTLLHMLSEIQIWRRQGAQRVPGIKVFQGVCFWGVSSGTFGRLVYWSYRLWLGFKMSEQDGTEDIAHWSIICLTWARPWLLFLGQTKQKLPHKDACDLRTIQQLVICHMWEGETTLGGLHLNLVLEKSRNI